MAGSPAITRNTHGAGEAWYVATALDEVSLASLLAHVLVEAGVPARGSSSVEVVTRVGEHSRFTFVINHSDEVVELPLTGTELVTGETAASTLVIPAGEVRVVRERNEQ